MFPAGGGIVKLDTISKSQPNQDIGVDNNPQGLFLTAWTTFLMSDGFIPAFFA